MRVSTPAFLVLIVSVLTIACSPVEPDAEWLQEAADASMEQGTVSFEMTLSSESAGTDLDGEQTMNGSIDFANERVELRFEEETIGEAVAIIDNDTMYMQMPLIALLAGTDNDEQWFSMSLEEDVWGGGGLSSGGFITEPGVVFDVLRASAATVTEQGHESIRGVETTHYLLVIDIETSFANDDLASFLEGVPLDMPEGLDIHIWIDSERLIRRMEYGYETDYGFGTGTTMFKTSIEFFDYGEPLDIVLPDPDDVIDFDEWLESLDTSDFGGITGAAFAGAECYGDRIEECFEPNPGLADLYGNPEECRGEEARVCLVPVGYVRRDVVEAILDFHRETAGIEIVVLPPVPISADDVDFSSSQGIAERIFGNVEAEYGLEGNERSTYIGLTSIDLRPEDDSYGWYFGYRNGDDGLGNVHGMFSYFRMANVEPYDGSELDDRLLFLRASKYMARYVALLHLKWPRGWDYDYVNYAELGGFFDLDSMGTKWPEGSPPCIGDGGVICLVPDGLYEDERFEADLLAVLPRLEAATGLKVELRLHGGAYPTWDPWSDEYRNDLHSIMARIIEDPDVVVLGVTDDPFANDWDLDTPIEPHITKAWPEEHMAVASGFNAGTPGTDEHRERLYRVLLRAVELAQGASETDEPGDLLYSGYTTPADLDAVTSGLP